MEASDWQFLEYLTGAIMAYRVMGLTEEEILRKFRDEGVTAHPDFEALYAQAIQKLDAETKHAR